MTQNDSASSAAETVAFEWQHVLAEDKQLVSPEFARIAFARPELRTLFPLITHGSLHFSRCTQRPWTRDVPALYPRAGGGFTVIRLSDGVTLGETETVEEAVELIVANLPEGCGPAIVGTANDL
ncbi:DUF6193 family natural product biosynthesis protein [Streptomyces sp. NPDC060064]|uniref:DUF6193 family natural product biosynthesis protein n=1 Tax=Streptomyces sp. NPDC060064 TaxID=3347049 RepID=UPI003680C7AB